MSPEEQRAKTKTKSLSFGGHESFAFRQGWLKKGVDGLAQNQSIFNDEAAIVNLGVGKNMVRSIRTWCLATQVIEEGSTQGISRAKTIQVSDLGKKLLFDNGWDPYCEDPTTLWLIHWLLVSNHDKLSLWRLMFMNFKDREFSRLEIEEFAKAQSKLRGANIEAGTIGRDADCFVRTYVRTQSRNKASGEEDFDCPLSELGIILSGSKDRFAFVVGYKETLSPEVFGFALGIFINQQESGNLAPSVSSLTYEQGSPGQAFKLDEDGLIEISRDLEDKYPDIVIVDVDGPVRRVGLRKNVDPSYFLEQYYEGGTR
jgi:hypothetical protein